MSDTLNSNKTHHKKNDMEYCKCGLKSPVKLLYHFLTLMLIPLTSEGKHTIQLLYHYIDFCCHFPSVMDLDPKIPPYINIVLQ